MVVPDKMLRNHKCPKVIYALSSMDTLQIVNNLAKYTVMKTKNVNFINLRVEVVYPCCGHIGDLVKMLNFITIS